MMSLEHEGVCVAGALDVAARRGQVVLDGDFEGLFSVMTGYQLGLHSSRTDRSLSISKVSVQITSNSAQTLGSGTRLRAFC